MNKRTPHNNYDAFVLTMFGQGNWFQVRRDLRKLFSHLDCLFICDLLNLAAMHRCQMDEEGYFRCTVKMLEHDGMIWSPDQQDTRFRSLCGRPKKGEEAPGKAYVQTKLKGCPAERWVRVDLEQLWEDMNEVLRCPENPENQLPENHGNWSPESSGNPCNRKTNKKTETPLPPCGAADAAPGGSGGTARVAGHTNRATTKPPRGKAPPNPQDKERAKLLYNALLVKGKRPDNTKLDDWAREITKLREDRQANPQEGAPALDEVLGWYCDNINAHEFMPQAYCGRSFRLKFDKIVYQMNKANRPPAAVTGRPARLAPDQLNATEREVYDQLDQFAWPKGSHENLPQCVRDSLQNYRAFHRQLIPLSETHPDGKVRAMALHWWTRELTPRDYVPMWIEQQGRRLAGWADWEGHLPAVTLDGAQFRKAGLQSASEIGYGAAEWDALITAVKERLR